MAKAGLKSARKGDDIELAGGDGQDKTSHEMKTKMCGKGSMEAKDEPVTMASQAMEAKQAGECQQ